MLDDSRLLPGGPSEGVHMGLNDLVNKGKDLLDSEKAEQVSDDILAKGSDFADQKTGGKYSGQIDQGVEHLDRQIGNQ
jgi:hypothetical protein